jgi:hypothetical protein
MRTAHALVAGALLVTALPVTAGPAVAARGEGAPAADWAPWGTSTVHPGVMTSTNGSRCTSNFLFTDADDHLYLGQAAHCARSDAKARPNPDNRPKSGCTFGSHALETPVTFVGSKVTGTLAYSSWLAMQENGETDSAACEINDFALVAIPDSARAEVNPSVPYFGGPTALGTGPVAAGEPVATFGNSPTRQGIDAIDVKQGYVVGASRDGWSFRIVTATPGIPGDSGSGLVDSAGRAIGIITTLSLEPPGANGVVDANKAIAYARKHSGIRGLRLVPGTEAFVGPNVVAALAPPPLRAPVQR